MTETTQTTTTDAGKTVETKVPEAKVEDKGGDDLEALKKHNKALLTELTTKKSELNDYKGKYDALQSEKDARETAELEKQGEFKKLLEKEQAKNKSFQNQVLKAQLKAAAFKEGIIDDDLIDVIPTDKIQINTVNDSIQISGAEEAVKAYKASKPHLFKALETITAAAGAQTAGTATTGGKPTGASVTEPNSAGTTTNALANGVKPGSKEAKALEEAYYARYK